jgi:hypothetical protein
VPTRQEIGGLPQQARTPETEDDVLQAFDDDGRRSIFEELYLPLTYQYFRRIHEGLTPVIPNMLRLARENLIKRARLFLQMKGGNLERLL